MNERDIFLAAIEIADPAERAAYLDEACGENTELRAQVEELLKTHNETSQFLETPAVETDSAVDRTVLTDGSDTDEDSGDERASGEVEFRKYLEPATRPGWLGRLAHYEIEEILGRGAFGIVAKAFDKKLHRVVAIKLMASELAATSPPRKRFLREARTAAAVMHENIAAIHAVEEEPIPYLVMEYIPGQTLQQRMDGHGPLEVPDVLRIGQQVASGMAAAHAVNLIHRDIKPSNILLSDGPNERAKISDFGLARAMDDASLTQSGMIAGTPMYMAPEQARGETLDHRADLFSLGSVLYQMAGGRPPFRASNTVAVLKRVCEDTPRPLGDVLPGTPDWLEAIIFKLLEKDRDDRYQTAQEVADLLARCQRELEDNGKVTCVEVSAGNAATQVFRPQTSTGSGAKKKPLGWLVGGVIAVAAVIGIVLMNGGKETPDSDLTNSAGNTTSASTTGTPADPTVATTWHNWPADAPAPAIAPFDAKQARSHQEAWAKYLGVPVEKEVSLGQDKNGKDVTLTMVLIPPDEFMIGTTDDEQGRWLSEAKAQNPNAKPDTFATVGMEDDRFVRITKPFWLSKLEFTTGQFRRFVESAGYRTEAETNGQGAARYNYSTRSVERLPELHWDNWGKISVDAGPVVNVSWNDAAKCCEWLSSQHPGMTFSLPTEAQWEFACRAGTKNSLYDCETGEQLREYAQFGDEVHFIQRGGQRRPNAFGLYDTLGNVNEWCLNWLEGYAASPTDDPAGPAVPGRYEMRAVRGGSFIANLWRVRSSKRDFFPPDDCFFDRGFRVSAAISEDLIRSESPTNAIAPTRAGETGSFQWPADAPPPAIAPFDADQAKAHQDAWAKHLGVPVEYENTIGMKFRLIPPGEFLMGSTSEEIEAALKVAGEDETWRERINSEAPQHKVVLTQPVYVGVTEVTQAQYEQVMGANPSHFSTTGEGKDAVANLETGNHPVEMVSWNDAAEFCAKLSQQEQLKPFYFRSGETITPLDGTGYRLPTEAEWESACRAGTTTRFWSGDTDQNLVSAGWFGSNSGGRTHAAGELKANPFGLWDVHGNVWEWVQDSWDPAFYGKFEENAAVDPSSLFSAGSQRVVRGGHWLFDPSRCRSSHRLADHPTSRNHGIGFRVVLVAESVRVSRP